MGAMRMNLAEIKAAVDAGKNVHWSNKGYRVHKTSSGEYLINFGQNESSIGLTNRAGTTLNGQPKDFFIDDTNEGPSREDMREEITITAQFIYDAPAVLSKDQQSLLIYKDLVRLLSEAENAAVFCVGFTIQSVAFEAETYGNVA